MLKKLINWLLKPLRRFLDNEIIQRLVRNSGYLFSSTSVSAVLSMVQGILIARLLGVENFGILGAITLFTSVVNKLASFRMSELVVKYVGEFTVYRDTTRAASVFKLAAIVEFLSSLLAFAIVLLLAPLAATHLAKDPSTTNLFRLYGLIIPANFINESSVGLLQIYDRFRRMATINIVQSLITLFLIILAYLNHGGLPQILFSYMTGKIIGALGISFTAFLMATRQWGLGWWKTPIKLLKERFNELASFGISTNISASISLITKDSEVLWVSFFRTPLEAGYYKLALALANIVQMPVSPLPQATYPELSRQSAQNQWRNMRYIMRQGSILAGAYTIIATLGLIVLGPAIIRYIYAPEFLPAYPALLILLVGLLFANTFYWRRGALLSLGRADFPAKVNALLAGLKILLVLVLVPQFGYLAAAALLSGFYISNSAILTLKIRSLLAEKAQ
ncbi:MAG: oligosaccharide flippase family protein [Anaerolineales bacterium]|jgi:O-antigen/teichoic acid export membrane protein